ncbi:MAG: AAA family ATPase, partial [Gaiellaceae bacterium]
MRFVSTPTIRPRAAADEVVGRDDVLAAIADFLEGAPGSALVLEGSAGIGKTTVWLAALELARERGFEVLSARPTGAEVSLSLAGLGDLLRGIPRRAMELLPAPQSRAIAVALAEEDAGGERIDGHVLGIALLNLLLARAEGSRVLLAIDDLQWLDESSGAVVVFALRRIGGADIRLLAARRDEPGKPLPLGLEQSLDEGSLRRIDLGPLSEGAIRRLLRQRLGLSVSRSQLHAVYGATGGNPFFALELARAGLRMDDEGLIHLPGSLEALVRQRLQSLPAATRDALLYVAALSEPRLVVLERARALGQLEPAIEAGILGLEGEVLRFDHPLIAAAAWRMGTAERRRAVHLALAEASDDQEQRARHLALGTTVADAGVAALVESAAALARARGAPAAAAELLDRALELTPAEDTEPWGRRVAAAAAAHAVAGSWERVVALGEEARERLPAGPDRAAVLVAAAEMRPGLAPLFRDAVVEAGETAVGVRAGIGLADQAAAAGNWQEAIQAAEEAVALARRLGKRDLLGAALTSLGGSRLLDSDWSGRETLGEALEIERELGSLPTSAYGSPAIWRVLTLIWQDEVEEARPLLDDLLARTREEGDEVSLFQLLWLSGFVELAEGDPWRARARWRDGLEAVEALGYDYVGTSFLVLLAAIEAHEGNLARARRLNDEALPRLDATADVTVATCTRAAQLFVELCEGNARAALAHADAVSAVFPSGRESLWSRHQGDEIEALVLAG